MRTLDEAGGRPVGRAWLQEGVGSWIPALHVSVGRGHTLHTLATAETRVPARQRDDKGP